MEEAQRSQLLLCCGSLGSLLSTGDTGQERSVPKQNKDWVEMGTAAVDSSCWTIKALGQGTQCQAGVR